MKVKESTMLTISAVVLLVLVLLCVLAGYLAFKVSGSVVAGSIVTAGSWVGYGVIGFQIVGCMATFRVCPFVTMMGLVIFLILGPALLMTLIMDRLQQKQVIYIRYDHP